MPNSHSPHGPDVDRLTSWKQIGTYLQKSDRTVRRWEKLGLPIHRVRIEDGESIYAFRSEIDAWMSRRERRGSLGSTLSTGSVQVALAVVFVPLAMWGALNLSRGDHEFGLSKRSGIPARWEVTTEHLRVLDETGALCWERSFGAPLLAHAYKPTVRDSAGAVAIEDLDADGVPEVLFVARTDEAATSRLYCLGVDGRTRFEHSVKRAVSFGQTTHLPPFSAQRFLLTADAVGGKAIWVISGHNLWFPSCVQKLNARGEVIGEFWHPGHIVSMPWQLVVAGRKVIAFGGTNNEFWGGALAVVDHENPSGSAPASRAEYRCTDCPPGGPIAYVVFPRMDLSKLWNTRPYVDEIRQEANGKLVVSVTQTDALPGYPLLVKTRVYYHLDGVHRVVTAEPGTDYPALHSRLQLLGRIDHPFGPSDLKDLYSVLAWSGQTFESPLSRAPAPGGSN